MGNKIDLENQREVSEKRGRKVSSRVCFGFCVSLPKGPPLAEISYASAEIPREISEIFRDILCVCPGLSSALLSMIWVGGHTVRACAEFSGNSNTESIRECHGITGNLAHARTVCSLPRPAEGLGTRLDSD